MSAASLSPGKKPKNAVTNRAKRQVDTSPLIFYNFLYTFMHEFTCSYGEKTDSSFGAVLRERYHTILLTQKGTVTL